MFRSTVIALCIATTGLALTTGSNRVASIDADEWLRQYSGGLNSQVYIPTFRGEGFGVRLTPSTGNYPVRISQARFYFSDNETGSRGRWRMRIYDDDGPGDTCGTVLLDTVISSHLDRWNTVTIQRDIILRSGSFYVFAYCDTWGSNFLPFPHFRFDNDLSPDYLNYDSAPGGGHSFRRWIMPGRIGDPYFEAYVTGIDYDVAVTRIVAPIGEIDSGLAIMPACSVANYGRLTAASYTVRLQVGDFRAIANVGNHAPGTSRLVSFPVMPVLPRGTYPVCCTTELADDDYSANDRLLDSVRVRVWDVDVSDILSPTGLVDSGATSSTEVLVGNSGTESVTAMLHVGIGDWRDSVTLLIPAGEQSIAGLRDWTAQRRGVNAVRCSLALAGDMRPQNNTRSGVVHVQVHDLAALAILEPTGANPPGELAPRGVVANRGTGREPCSATFTINSTPHYSATLPLPGGLPLGDTTLTFPSWTATVGGFTARCSVGLATEQVPANNVATAGFSVGRTDVGVLAITAPSGAFDTAQQVLPAAWVISLGDGTVAPRAWMVLRDSIETTVYCESIDLDAITAGDSVLAEFPEWPLPHAAGSYTAACSVAAPFDENPSNDCAAGEFSIFTHPPLPTGWSEVTNVPLEPSGRAVKDGGWLCPVGDWAYVAKGYKTGDFYRFSFASNSWQYRAAIPLGEEDKQPGKGASACDDGERFIYATKGNNTLGFWRYDTQGDSWNALEPVPVGMKRRRVKGGSDMVKVRHPRSDTEYVYLLKGGNTEFYRYNILTGRWRAMPDAPAVDKPKWDKGSWLVYDGDRTIYAHRAKYHDLYRYDLAGDTWSRTALTGMPLQSRYTGRSRKSKDGGSAVWQSGAIFALKGGNSNEFYRYDVGSAIWTELDTLPTFGSSAKKRRVKAGGSLCNVGGQFLAIKGSKSTECWAWTPAVQGAPGRPAAGAQSGSLALLPAGRMAVTPNPLTGSRASIAWSRPLATARDLVLFDIAGRPVFRTGISAGRTRGDLDLGDLAAGVYLVRLADDPAGPAAKLIIQR
jgi:hypothetical protein